MMNLEELIHKSPAANAAFRLPDVITLERLIEQCNLVGKTVYIDVTQVDIASLREQFSEYEIVVLTNVESLNDEHALLYSLSTLLDYQETFVLCIVNDTKKFNHIQYDKLGALYLRWFLIDDFERFLPMPNSLTYI
jgi:hypothetical protein